MDLKELTLQVCEIAKKTGDYLRGERKNFKKENIIEKNRHDYVSYVDKEAEKRIVAALLPLLPDAGFITEEGTIDLSGKEYNWIIDPLDGTTNFIQDYAPYCVSIALSKGEELLIGVVYEVCRNECFYAWKDGKAWLNNTPIRVSENPMEKAFIGVDLPYETEKYKPFLLSLINDLYGKTASLRISGSAAASLCYVAAGRYDGWVEAFIKIWDFAAAVLIIREAGGIVTDLSGNEPIFHTHHILATNGVIHEELKKLLPLNKLTL